MLAFGLEMSEGKNWSKNKLNSEKNEWKQKYGERRDDLPWLRDLDSSTRELCQNTSDNKCNKQFRLLLAEMSITQISFIQHIHGNLQGKTGPEVDPDI